MYDYIKGVLACSSANQKGYFATVETYGIGYLIEIIGRDFAKLPDVNSEIKIYTVLNHKEDKMSLCGFLKREDRDIFNILTSVSGVGLKMALTLINSFDVSTLVGLVLEGNFKELTRAKGVGPKLAQKIILELKDKLTNYGQVDNVSASSQIVQVNCLSQNVEDALQVLYSLGYSKDEVSGVIGKVLQATGADAPAEDVLKEALRILSL